MDEGGGDAGERSTVRVRGSKTRLGVRPARSQDLFIPFSLDHGHPKGQRQLSHVGSKEDATVVGDLGLGRAGRHTVAPGRRDN